MYTSYSSTWTPRGEIEDLKETFGWIWGHIMMALLGYIGLDRQGVQAAEGPSFSTVKALPYLDDPET